MASIGSWLKHAWNAFSNEDDQVRKQAENQVSPWYGPSSSGERPDRLRLRIGGDKTILTSIYTRMAIDVAGIDIRHVRLDDQSRYIEDIPSGLNNCLTVEANTDQGARAFRQDIAMTLFDEGVAALVAVDTTISPLESGGYDILTLRVGRVVQWMPQHVRVSLWNEVRGRREEITLPKKSVALIENPLYAVMNAPNSTLQRLIRKLSLLDAIDEQSASGKLDLIIQLPYMLKTETKKQQAETRREEIEYQLRGSQYGIAYTDGTEKITQLNRPAENNLLKQIEYLTEMLYGQLGITAEVMNGTADEKVMLNYFNRTIEPILDAISEAMIRSFLTKTARTQKQSILYFRDPFKLVPVSDLAEIADKFTRNEIFSSNEIRQFVGVKPSKDPKADQLVNSNMPVSDTGTVPGEAAVPPADDASKVMNDAFDEVSRSLDQAFADLGADESV